MRLLVFPFLGFATLVTTVSLTAQHAPVRAQIPIQQTDQVSTSVFGDGFGYGTDRELATTSAEQSARSQMFGACRGTLSAEQIGSNCSLSSIADSARTYSCHARANATCLTSVRTPQGQVSTAPLAAGLHTVPVRPVPVGTPATALPRPLSSDKQPLPSSSNWAPARPSSMQAGLAPAPANTKSSSH